jgi:uncharacterized SAM-binding protein YcdF (DUF218 family)
MRAGFGESGVYSFRSLAAPGSKADRKHVELPFEFKSAMIRLMIRRGKPLLKIVMILATLVVLLAAALFLFPQAFLSVDGGEAKADVIIVLGGGGTHERPEYAARLFLDHAAPRVLVSGAGDDEINRRILIRDGVPAQDIELEGKSKTTRENARFCAEILQAKHVKSAIIVTSWYHSRRALKTFEHFAPGIKFYSRPSYFNYKHSHWGRDFSRRVYWEYVKLPGYWVAYGVWPF